LASSYSNSSLRELQKLIKSTSSPSSPFHQSHAAGSTDVTVYPPPSASHSTEEPDKKKRKREAAETNDRVLSDTQHARFPNLFHTNKHLVTVHETLKKEGEQIIELTVSSTFSCTSAPLHLRITQDKVKLWINLTMPKCVSRPFRLSTLHS
jgi:proteasome activator subunit 3 (PA28 gamma)